MGWGEPRDRMVDVEIDARAALLSELIGMAKQGRISRTAAITAADSITESLLDVLGQLPDNGDAPLPSWLANEVRLLSNR